MIIVQDYLLGLYTEAAFQKELGDCLLFLSLVPCVNMETADFERWSYFMSFKFELYYTLFREESTRGNLHYHNFYEIVYYESGAGYTTIEGKKSHYTPGTYAFLPPNTAHDEFCETDSNIHILTFSGCGPGEQQLPAGLYADQDSTVFLLHQQNSG